MSNKNPFEIRAEMLAMAKDYMDQQWHMNLDFTRQLYEQNKKTVEEMQEALKAVSSKESKISTTTSTKSESLPEGVPDFLSADLKWG